MKKSLRKITFILVAVFLLGFTALASTLQIIDVPTANTVGANKGQLTVWSNFSTLKVKGIYSPMNDLDLALQIKGHQNLFAAYASAKWQFMHQTANNPSAAIGIGNDAIYAVVTHNFSSALAGHLGLGAGELATVFAGLDYNLTLGSGAPPVKLLAEINHSLNIGFIAQIAPAFDVTLAIKDLDNLNLGANFKFVF